MQSSALLGRTPEGGRLYCGDRSGGIPTCFTGTFVFGTGETGDGDPGRIRCPAGTQSGGGAPCQRKRGEPGALAMDAAIVFWGRLPWRLKLQSKIIWKSLKGWNDYLLRMSGGGGAGSKQFMTQAGLFDNVDFVYTWHPSTVNRVAPSSSNAIMGADFSFRGITAHAGSSPHLGRSALGRAELMNIEAQLSERVYHSGSQAPQRLQRRGEARPPM